MAAVQKRNTSDWRHAETLKQMKVLGGIEENGGQNGNGSRKKGIVSETYEERETRWAKQHKQQSTMNPAAPNNQRNPSSAASTERTVRF